MKKILTALFFNLLLTIVVVAQQATNCDIATGMGNVTLSLDSLGNISESQGMTDRALNIWDLQTFQDRLYIAYGSTVTNAGPIGLWSIDTNCDFEFEKNIQAEAIEKFRVYNNTLFVPSSDPLGGSSDLSKLSLKTAAGVWNDYTWSPSLAHVRDILFYKNEYYHIGNSWSPISKLPQYSGVHVTDINLNNPSLNLLSSELTAADPYENPKWNWFFGGFEFRDTLVMPNAMLTLGYVPNLTIPDNIAFIKTPTSLKWTANMPINTRITHDHLYPVDVTIPVAVYPDYDITIRPFESIVYGNKLLVSFRTYAFDDLYLPEYNNSAGMICKSYVKEEAHFINFPAANVVGEDMFVQNGDLYVLGNRKNNANSYTVYVYKTGNPSLAASSWTEVLRFTSTNRARSFEHLNGFLYFGLGNDYDEPINHAGELLRVKVNCPNVNCSTGGLPCNDNNVCTINDTYDSNCNCYGIEQDSDGDGICDVLDCINNLYVDNTLLNQNNEFTANIHLESDATVASPFQIHFTAGDNVVLLPGFEMQNSTVLKAEILPCN